MSNSTPPYGPPPQVPPPYLPPPQAPPSYAPPPPARFGGSYPNPPTYTHISGVPEGEKDYVATLLLSVFLGIFGVDRFYLGKTKSGFVKLLTFGGMGYWWLFDMLMTLFGKQRDVWGLRLAGYDRNKKKVWLAIGSIFAFSFAFSLVGLIGMAAFSADGLTPIGWGLLGTAAAGGGLWWIRRKRANKQIKQQQAAQPIASQPQQQAPAPNPIPASIQIHVDRLASLRKIYVLHAAAGDQRAAAVSHELGSLISNTRALFQRLRANSEDNDRQIAEIQYEEKLGKLAAGLDQNYLLDVLTNPNLWDNPDQRASDVQVALEAVNSELLNNVREVNALRSLKFEVALDQLLDPWNKPLRP